MSSNALEAYIRETKGTKKFFKKIAAVKELDRSIREAFFFPSDPLEFWFGVEGRKGSEQIEIFYRSGEIIFKGFETTIPIVVYEMLNPDGDMFKTLERYHFNRWLEESKDELVVDSF